MREWFEELGFLMKVFVIAVILAFAIGGVTLAWVKVFSPKFADQQRQQFQHSQSHQDAVVQDLTARCADLTMTSDPGVRKAIEVVIAQRASVEDLSKLQMADSVRACVNKALDEYVNGGTTK